MLKKLKVIFDKVVDSAALLASFFYIFIMLAVSLGVFMRYVMKSPLLWVVEITSYALLGFTFLGATWLLKRDGHVTMDFVVGMLKPRTQDIIEAITSFVCAIMFLIIAFYGALVTLDHFKRGLFDANAVLRIPQAYPLLIIPIGCLLLFIQLTIRGWNRLRHDEASQKEHKGLTQK